MVTKRKPHSLFAHAMILSMVLVCSYPMRAAEEVSIEEAPAIKASPLALDILTQEIKKGSRGAVLTIKKLLQFSGRIGPPIDLGDEDSSGTSLLAATTKNVAQEESITLQILELLLSHWPKLDVNYPSGPMGLSPLGYAVLHQPEHVVTLLLAHDANPDGVAGAPPLVDAAEVGDYQIVKQLLEAGTDPNAVNSNTGRSALSHAAEDGNDAMVQLLIRAGAHTGQADTDGLKPSDYAIRNGHVSTAQILRQSRRRRPPAEEDVTPPAKHRKID